MGREEPCRFIENDNGNRSSDWRTEGPLPNHDEMVGRSLVHDVGVLSEDLDIIDVQDNAIVTFFD